MLPRNGIFNGTNPEWKKPGMMLLHKNLFQRTGNVRQKNYTMLLTRNGAWKILLMIQRGCNEIN
jgi:hypothetical protein